MKKSDVLVTLQENSQKGVTLAELVKITEKSEKQIGNAITMLRSDGYDIRETYDDKGNIFYSFGTSLERDIVTINPTSDEVRVLFISDIHLGQENDGLENLNKAIEYALKNNIHIILNLGDLFDGVTINNYKLSFPQQLERFTKFYPYNRQLLHFMLLGNHDMTIYTNCGFDVAKKISTRPDIINLGYGIGKIRLGQEVIGLCHDLVLDKSYNSLKGTDIVFKGHNHKFECLDTMFRVPALLGKQFSTDLLSTGFLDVVFTLDNDKLVSDISVKHLAFFPDPTAINNIHLKLKSKKKI